jgi:hypothetical protein
VIKQWVVAAKRGLSVLCSASIARENPEYQANSLSMLAACKPVENIIDSPRAFYVVWKEGVNAFPSINAEGRTVRITADNKIIYSMPKVETTSTWLQHDGVELIHPSCGIMLKVKANRPDLPEEIVLLSQMVSVALTSRSEACIGCGSLNGCDFCDVEDEASTVIQCAVCLMFFHERCSLKLANPDYLRLSLGPQSFEGVTCTTADLPQLFCPWSGTLLDGVTQCKADPICSLCQCVLNVKLCEYEE